MHFLGIVQWNSTRRDHPGNPGGVFGSGPVMLYQCYTKSERSIASPTTIKRHLLHMDHPLDLRHHPLQLVCRPFEVEGEEDLIGEVVVEMVGEVVREVVVHLS